MLEKGIAYRKTGVVNWDPIDSNTLCGRCIGRSRTWRRHLGEGPVMSWLPKRHQERVLSTPRQDAPTGNFGKEAQATIDSAAHAEEISLLS